jgi:hypothetical protein
MILYQKINDISKVCSCVLQLKVGMITNPYRDDCLLNLSKYRKFLSLFKGRTECVCDEQEGFVYWNETQKCYRVYTQGPCPDNAWLIPADDLPEVFCECRSGYHFSPSQYACIPTPIVENVGNHRGLQLLPYIKNHKIYRESSSTSDYDEVMYYKIGVLRASHKIFNSEVRICWNDASKFSSISSSQLTDLTGPGRSDSHCAGALN